MINTKKEFDFLITCYRYPILSYTKLMKTPTYSKKMEVKSELITIKEDDTEYAKHIYLTQINKNIKSFYEKFSFFSCS